MFSSITYPLIIENALFLQQLVNIDIEFASGQKKILLLFLLIFLLFFETIVKFLVKNLKTKRIKTNRRLCNLKTDVNIRDKECFFNLNSESEPSGDKKDSGEAGTTASFGSANPNEGGGSGDPDKKRPSDKDSNTDSNKKRRTTSQQPNN